VGRDGEGAVFNALEESSDVTTETSQTSTPCVTWARAQCGEQVNGVSAQYLVELGKWSAQSNVVKEEASVTAEQNRKQQEAVILVAAQSGLLETGVSVQCHVEMEKESEL